MKYLDGNGQLAECVEHEYVYSPSTMLVVEGYYCANCGDYRVEEGVVMSWDCWNCDADLDVVGGPNEDGECPECFAIVDESYDEWDEDEDDE